MRKSVYDWLLKQLTNPAVRKTIRVRLPFLVSKIMSKNIQRKRKQNLVWQSGELAILNYDTEESAKSVYYPCLKTKLLFLIGTNEKFKLGSSYPGYVPIDKSEYRGVLKYTNQTKDFPNVKFMLSKKQVKSILRRISNEQKH